MKRREFVKAASTVMFSAAVSGDSLAQLAHEKDVTYEPNRPLESTGLSIEDGLKILKKGRKNNFAPVIREEILDNPDAVFIIKGDIKTTPDENGMLKPVPDQMERLGLRVSNLLFRKGTEKGGQTFLKPNMVGSGLTGKNTVGNCHGGAVHPYFTAGFSDGLRDIGNSNIAAGIRGALRHNHVVDSGLKDLFDAHNLPLIEAHVQYFKDYKRSSLIWHKNPDGMVQRQFCTYKPACLKDTNFINMAHAHTHKVGHTTLTLKNIQGIMPRGYGHICDAWSTLHVWRASLLEHFNKDFQQTIERSYVKHGNMGYKYWDEGGFFKTYKADGGYKVYMEKRKKHEDAEGEARKAAFDELVDMADTRLFWAEIWSQRMMDIIEALPSPHLNMVDGIFARGAQGTVLADFITVGRSSVAVDAITTWLMGHDPREVPYLRIAKERGLGENDIEKIPVFMLDDKGPVRLRDYRMLDRVSLGIHNFGGIRDHKPVIFS